MSRLRNPFYAGLAALALALAPMASAQSDRSLEELLAELADPETEDWQGIEDRVIDLWSRSGSRTMDLLLDRGREALENEEFDIALEHFTALTDHAPEFAEGWNMRATTFFMIDEYSLSIADIGRTLSLNPDHFSALNGLGIILEELDDYPNALMAYRLAHEKNPHRENLSDAIERLERLVDGAEI